VERLSVSRIEAKGQGENHEHGIFANVQRAWLLRSHNVLCPVQLLRASLLLYAGWLLCADRLLHAGRLLPAACWQRPDSAAGRMRCR
jgi:hypothetical protein